MTGYSMRAFTGRPITGRHVLIWLLGFFGFVMAVNAIFVYLALDSFSGLSTEQAYRKGLDYNQALEAVRAQRALGWQVEVESALPGFGQPLALTVSVQGRDGAPLTGMTLRGQLRRPVEEQSDQALVFAELGEGRYRAQTPLPYLGNWDLRLTVARADGAQIEIERRLWLKSSR